MLNERATVISNAGSALAVAVCEQPFQHRRRRCTQATKASRQRISVPDQRSMCSAWRYTKPDIASSLTY